ncbi:DUF416 family protein [Dyadobacter sp. CY261]|uniref:DUF416 family protein n=1 Tax=Dyadobacter sp. CY261 TaxID=2907203 RepID=UPI0038D3696A
MAQQDGLDACTAVLSTLNYLIEPQLEHIVWVATFARDTVDMYVGHRNDANRIHSNTDHKIESDPLMIREKERQRRLLSELSSLDVTQINERGRCTTSAIISKSFK